MSTAAAQHQATITFAGIIVRIFDEQRELMRAFKETEQLPEPPISLHSLHGQRIIKDFAWRTTEELMEAYDTRVAHMMRHDDRAAHLFEAQGEELADALHFFVELALFAGIPPQSFLSVCQQWPMTSSDHLPMTYLRVVYRLSCAVHELRNRPWKRNPIPTNEAEFRSKLGAAFLEMMRLWSVLGYTKEDMLEFYLRKNAANVNRAIVE